ncbi:MAG: EscU/YscU/HrcU family type III secretion system export apparatus switch protein, partial [Firmicutes bacterium]|nr:EscU/YscU/HrcU family type III secretion system export apparatus switch protein [Bacillota bacterium]
KACFKFGVIGAVVYLALRAELHRFFLLPYMAPGPAFLTVGRVVLGVAAWAGVAYLVLGVVDFLYQRYEYMRTMRMTRFELKEELRQTEGDPLVRARQRERQRQIALNRIRQEVPRATVVITNPVHLAVALRYAEEMLAPRVVAKGAGLLAEQIRMLAARYRVPVVENPEVARFLFYRVDVGREIPRELYRAVAEILAAVYRLPGRIPGA